MPAPVRPFRTPLLGELPAPGPLLAPLSAGPPRTATPFPLSGQERPAPIAPLCPRPEGSPAAREGREGGREAGGPRGVRARHARPARGGFVLPCGGGARSRPPFPRSVRVREEQARHRLQDGRQRPMSLPSHRLRSHRGLLHP